MHNHHASDTILTPPTSSSHASSSTIPISPANQPGNGAPPRRSVETMGDASPSSSYPPRTRTRDRADSSPRISRNSYHAARSPRTPQTSTAQRPGHVSRRSIAHGPAILGFNVRSPPASAGTWGGGNGAQVGLGVLGTGGDNAIAEESGRSPEEDVYWDLDLNSPMKPRARPDAEEAAPRSSMGGPSRAEGKGSLWTQWGSFLGAGPAASARSAPPGVQVFDADELEGAEGSGSRGKGKDRGDAPPDLSLEEGGHASIAMEKVGPKSQGAAAPANGAHHDEDSPFASDAEEDESASLPAFGLGPHEAQLASHTPTRTGTRPYGQHNRSLHDLTLGAGVGAGADDSLREGDEEDEDAALLFARRSSSSSEDLGKGEGHRRRPSQQQREGTHDDPYDSYDAEAALGYGMADLAPPGGGRGAKLDFEPLARGEKVAYWVVTCCVITLSLVAVSIGVDWIGESLRREARGGIAMNRTLTIGYMLLALPSYAAQIGLVMVSARTRRRAHTIPYMALAGLSSSNTIPSLATLGLFRLHIRC